MGDSNDSSTETVKIASCGSRADHRLTVTDFRLSEFFTGTASATIIAMTMSVFEFSEPGNASAFTRHISN